MRLTCQSSSTSLCTSNGDDNGLLENGDLKSEDFTNTQEPIIHAMNEVILHRGRSPHLTMLNISIDGVFLTEAIVHNPFYSEFT
jgi:NAD kinase